MSPHMRSQHLINTRIVRQHLQPQIILCVRHHRQFKVILPQNIHCRSHQHHIKILPRLLPRIMHHKLTVPLHHIPEVKSRQIRISKPRITLKQEQVPHLTYRHIRYHRITYPQQLFLSQISPQFRLSPLDFDSLVRIFIHKFQANRRVNIYLHEFMIRMYRLLPVPLTMKKLIIPDDILFGQVREIPD